MIWFLMLTIYFIMMCHSLLQAILSRGGRYLEAMIQGSKSDADEGKLICLTAGDHTLYTECESVFNAIAEKSIYLGK